MKKTLTAGIALLLASSVVAAADRVGPAGYLAPGAVDVLAILPPAPAPDDARGTADRAIFRATRALEGTPRWALATNDVTLSPVDMMRDYSCALGINLTPDNAPRTAALVRRAAYDTVRAMIIHRATPRWAGPGRCC